MIETAIGVASYMGLILGLLIVVATLITFFEAVRLKPYDDPSQVKSSDDLCESCGKETRSGVFSENSWLCSDCSAEQVMAEFNRRQATPPAN